MRSPVSYRQWAVGLVSVLVTTEPVNECARNGVGVLCEKSIACLAFATTHVNAVAFRCRSVHVALFNGLMCTSTDLSVTGDAAFAFVLSFACCISRCLFVVPVPVWHRQSTNLASAQDPLARTTTRTTSPSKLPTFQLA